MLLLLPPSETKAPGGDGAPLDLAALTAPELTGVRTELAEALVKLAGDVPAARAALGLSARQDAEIARNAQLWTSPTRPAVERYTGVLYDALAVRAMSRGQRARAGRRLVVASALFGLVGAEDPIPAYRLSAGSSLPGLPTVRAMWKPVLSPLLAAYDELVVDLRSGSYAAFAPLPGAVRLEVLSERPDGSRFGRQPRQQGPQGPGGPAAGTVDGRTAGRRATARRAAAGRVARGTSRRDRPHPRRPCCLSRRHRPSS